MAEIGPDFKMVRGNIYAGSEFLAEDAMDFYENASGTMLRISDQVGTLKARFDVFGNWVGGCTSFPFGDGMNCTVPTLSDMFFTGKQHDSESNFDDFGARYYSSTLSRWMSPKLLHEQRNPEASAIVE